MYEVFTKLLNMSMTAGILVFVVLALRLLLKKAPKKYICILWALVALRLLCPISISSYLSVFNLINMGTDAAGQIEYFQYNGKTEKPELLFDVPALVNDNFSTDSMTIGTKTSDLYLPTIMYIWLFGAVIMLTYAASSYMKLKKQVIASIHRRDQIYVCDDINTPFLLGFIKPRIYLPSGMKEYTEKNVIAHELAHLKRHDYLWKPLGYILLSVYWLQPILWVAYILFCRDIEAACDEKVIAEMDKDGIAGYSKALLFCAAHKRLITACPIAFGETGVKGRVKHILNYKKPAFWMICITIVACIIATVCLLTNPKYSEPVIVAVHEPNAGLENASEDGFTIFETYYEMSDGTWRTDSYSYKYRLEITGRGGTAVKDTTFLYLSNIEDISFHKAMMAAGYSSHMDDYFDEKDAKWIGFK